MSVGLGTVAAGASDTSNLFVLGETLKPGSLVTATLVWDRVVNTTMGNPNLGQLQMANSYAVQTVVNNTGPGNPEPLADLDLRLVKRGTGQTVAYVLSRNDNVEHLYFNIRDEGNYDLVVDNRSNRSTNYSLALSSGTSDGMAFTVDHSAQGKQAPMPGFAGARAGSPMTSTTLAGPARRRSKLAARFSPPVSTGPTCRRGSRPHWEPRVVSAHT